MKAFLSTHADSVALAGAVVLAVAIIALYVSGVSGIAATLDATLGPGVATAPVVRYDIEAAAKLDLKGNVAR